MIGLAAGFGAVKIDLSNHILAYYYNKINLDR